MPKIHSAFHHERDQKIKNKQQEVDKGKINCEIVVISTLQIEERIDYRRIKEKEKTGELRNYFVGP